MFYLKFSKFEPLLWYLGLFSKLVHAKASYGYRITNLFYISSFDNIWLLKTITCICMLLALTTRSCIWVSLALLCSSINRGCEYLWSNYIASSLVIFILFLILNDTYNFQKRTHICNYIHICIVQTHYVTT